MHLSKTALDIIAIAALVLSLLAATIVIALAARQRRRPKVDPDVPYDERLEMAAEFQARAIERLEGAVHQLAAGEKALSEVMHGAVQHVGMVRFDAFEDMGGRLSFSAALLDGNGDGMVITSINGRQDTRCYAKQVLGGTSLQHLSDEEEQAIREAIGGRRSPAPASQQA